MIWASFLLFRGTLPIVHLPEETQVVVSRAFLYSFNCRKESCHRPVIHLLHLFTFPPSPPLFLIYPLTKYCLTLRLVIHSYISPHPFSFTRVFTTKARAR